ncbi:Predicted permease%2C DMT superfamily [Bordetella ansorpii]|uniref:Predicted permease, DMT superfamily n=1 Tax=Bordetella ansorpii TaxID=288768 RepID=A0A157PR17_9BORD|nr:DMT family transporter [Bordetella ansorpii]SAI35740.1 Predicted permease%2C DMT superfamily [Bordetella ansorpii]
MHRAAEPPGLPSRDRTRGVLCAMAAVLLFSGFTLVSRMGLTTTALTLPDLAILRFAVAGLLLLPLLLRYRLSGLRLRQAALLAFSGGLGFALFAYLGFRLAPASHGGVLLHGTIPLFTFLLLRAALGLRAGRQRLAGLALIVAGVVAISWDSFTGAEPRQYLGDVALLLAAVCWAAYGLLAQRFCITPLRAAAIVAPGSLACFLPLYLMLPGTQMALAAWPDIVFQALFQGVLVGVVALLVYTRAVAVLGAQTTALFTAAVPCLTTLGALALLEELPSAAAWAGVVLVTAGMAVALSAARPQS